MFRDWRLVCRIGGNWLISIEIPITWGKYLDEQMEALRAQSDQDFEIIVANSSDNREVKDVLKRYDVKVIETEKHLLVKRYKAHKLSRGEYALLLDETRIPIRDMIVALNSFKHDMGIIYERDRGNNFWIRVSNEDRQNTLDCREFDPKAGYMLPRLFAKDLLSLSFEKVKNELPSDVFREILFEELQIVSFEAFNLSSDIKFIKQCLIEHYGDNTLKSIVLKYYKYGLYNGLLKKTKYDWTQKMSLRRRRYCAGNHLYLYMLQLTRGIPFMFGSYIGKISGNRNH